MRAATFNRVLVGDCQAWLPAIKSECVQTVVTSPPYWGLRDYGVAGQLGLERTPEEYVDKLVSIFKEIRRVLKPDGTAWLNLGDSYFGSWGNYGDAGGGQRRKETDRFDRRAYSDKTEWRPPTSIPHKSLKPKDLVGIPWRVAFALQAAGWWLRSDIIWHKPNPMPESVTDRPTKCHEYIFLLTKSERYFYDADAIKEDCQSGPSDIRKMEEGKERIGGKHKTLDDPYHRASKHTNMGQKRSVGDPSGRNKRSVWTVATVPFAGAHFATFPPALVLPCVLAGSRTGDLVLDPFAGSGTLGQVCAETARSFLGIELNPKYAELRAEERSVQTLPL